jgi:hypothetical protein
MVVTLGTRSRLLASLRVVARWPLEPSTVYIGSPDRVYQCSLVFVCDTIICVSFDCAHNQKGVGGLVLFEVFSDPPVKLLKGFSVIDCVLFVETIFQGNLPTAKNIRRFKKGSLCPSNMV